MGSLGLRNHKYQKNSWFIFYPVIGQITFIIFFISSLAEGNRIPFDLSEAESELVSGYTTEYSGIKFALFYLAEYVHLLEFQSWDLLSFRWPQWFFFESNF
ncbi:hypothetical protein CM15mP43_09060 [bacterium]|nr:MAG: hypothetical protein CM15mP43_09060 [bacterium]